MKPMSHPYNLQYEFGPFSLDLSKRVLTRTGVMITLTPKATELLIILVLNAGELIEKDELLNEVWPDTFVEESNLTQNIFTLRRALGDERADPRYIETVARRGYRFIAPVTTIRVKKDADSGVKEAATSARPVVAVLPFLNTTADQDLGYLAEGLTDNIINYLSRISKLRVMSRSAVVRYLRKEVDPQQAGSELGVDAVLVGKIRSAPTGVFIGVELVEVSTGWQLWGESLNVQNKSILEIQNAIARQVLATLKLELTGAEEQRVTTRYTENPAAYHSYLKGRYYSSQYTRHGIQRAIGYFRCAIKLDPNYALAYASIIDCYLRLATNYLPPQGDDPFETKANRLYAINGRADEANPKIKLRFEWDWKGAERELRRATELRTNYPSPHQWYGAYRAIKEIYEESCFSKHAESSSKQHRKVRSSRETSPPQIGSLELTSSEQVRVYCTIAREQIDTGNYDAACSILRPWWLFGNWPKLEELDQPSCADLLFTAGELAGCVASTRQLTRGQKHAEELLNGSIALFEQVGLKRRAAEGRIELALCYYRQGLFDVGRATLMRVIDELYEDNLDLRSLALIRLGSLERHAGKLKDALARLLEATSIVKVVGPWVTGRCYLELASTYKDLATSEEVDRYFITARSFYFRALYEFEAVGNHRLTAIVLNNLGCLMISMGNYSEAEPYLRRARRNFDCFNDKIRSAQADDSLARLYLAQRKFEEAEMAIERAVQIMENGDEDVLLAEALTTRGLVYCRTKRPSEARRALADAHRLASRCGDSEGAGRALLVLMEEMWNLLDADEQKQMGARLVELLSSSQQPSIHRRVRRCLDLIARETA